MIKSSQILQEHERFREYGHLEDEITKPLFNRKIIFTSSPLRSKYLMSHLFLWMMALKASPSLHDCVKSWTWTPGYLWVVFWAHLSRASLADRSSWPTTMSEIWNKRKIMSNLLWVQTFNKRKQKIIVPQQIIKNLRNSDEMRMSNSKHH